MGKITKKQYEQRKQFLLNQIEELEALQKEYISIFENEENKQEIINEYGDKWNNAEDKIWELKQELKFLDDEWDKRNWTQQDYYQYSLITDNID